MYVYIVEIGTHKSDKKVFKSILSSRVKNGIRAALSKLEEN